MDKDYNFKLKYLIPLKGINYLVKETPKDKDINHSPLKETLYDYWAVIYNIFIGFSLGILIEKSLENLVK